MARHTSEWRWAEVSELVTALAQTVKADLLSGEEEYQELQELYAYAGGTDQLLADQLFKEEIEARSETQANAEEVAKTADAVAAMLAIHQLFQAADNQTVAAADRIAPLRRMS